MFDVQCSCYEWIVHMDMCVIAKKKKTTTTKTKKHKNAREHRKNTYEKPLAKTNNRNLLNRKNETINEYFILFCSSLSNAVKRMKKEANIKIVYMLCPVCRLYESKQKPKWNYVWSRSECGAPNGRFLHYGRPSNSQRTSQTNSDNAGLCDVWPRRTAAAHDSYDGRAQKNKDVKRQNISGNRTIFIMLFQTVEIIIQYCAVRVRLVIIIIRKEMDGSYT